MWFDSTKKAKKPKQPKQNNKKQTALKSAGLKNSKICGVHSPFFVFLPLWCIFLQEQADF